MSEFREAALCFYGIKSFTIDKYILRTFWTQVHSKMSQRSESKNLRCYSKQWLSVSKTLIIKRKHFDPYHAEPNWGCLPRTRRTRWMGVLWTRHAQLVCWRYMYYIYNAAFLVKKNSVSIFYFLALVWKNRQHSADLFTN